MSDEADISWYVWSQVEQFSQKQSLLYKLAGAVACLADPSRCQFVTEGLNVCSVATGHRDYLLNSEARDLVTVVVQANQNDCLAEQCAFIDRQVGSRIRHFLWGCGLSDAMLPEAFGQAIDDMAVVAMVQFGLAGLGERPEVARLIEEFVSPRLNMWRQGVVVERPDGVLVWAPYAVLDWQPLARLDAIWLEVFEQVG